MKQEIKQKKKELNKKFVIPLMIVLGVAIISAIGYYAMFSVTLNVNQPISVSGELTQSLDCDAGDKCEGSPITISNSGDNSKVVKIVQSGDENIGVEYIGKLDLSKKDTSTWELIGETTEVKYTLTGDSFNYEVELPEGYALIYAKDHQDRFNNPSEFILAENVNFSLPQEDDWNIGEEANYCSEPDNYEHCKGAKLWAVPTSDLNEDGTLSWANMNDYLWEKDLVYYFDNVDNELTIPANSFITFYPVFNPDSHLSGEYVLDFEVQ